MNGGRSYGEVVNVETTGHAILYVQHNVPPVVEVLIDGAVKDGLPYAPAKGIVGKGDVIAPGGDAVF